MISLRFTKILTQNIFIYLLMNDSSFLFFHRMLVQDIHLSLLSFLTINVIIHKFLDASDLAQKLLVTIHCILRVTLVSCKVLHFAVVDI